MLVYFVEWYQTQVYKIFTILDTVLTMLTLKKKKSLYIYFIPNASMYEKVDRKVGSNYNNPGCSVFEYL
jgi:hypothetical protein